MTDDFLLEIPRQEGVFMTSMGPLNYTLFENGVRVHGRFSAVRPQGPGKGARSNCYVDMYLRQTDDGDWTRAGTWAKTAFTVNGKEAFKFQGMSALQDWSKGALDDIIRAIRESWRVYFVNHPNLRHEIVRENIRDRILALTYECESLDAWKRLKEDNLALLNKALEAEDPHEALKEVREKWQSVPGLEGSGPRI